MSTDVVLMTMIIWSLIYFNNITAPPILMVFRNKSPMETKLHLQIWRTCTGDLVPLDLTPPIRQIELHMIEPVKFILKQHEINCLFFDVLSVSWLQLLSYMEFLIPLNPLFGTMLRYWQYFIWLLQLTQHNYANNIFGHGVIIFNKYKKNRK
jgi:hypothetical protein